MAHLPVLLDVSSDDEEKEEQARLEEKGEMNNDYVWIKEFLQDVSDDEEQNGVKKTEGKSKSLISTVDVRDVDDDDDDDDDCVVLDGNPENLVTSVQDSPTGSDELFVTGEKGQIACRDYPHPRHLCVNFPYSSTPHEKHCDQCHCYVCDSLAPCLKWGTGLSSTDHCHATDKSEIWKTLRKNCKLAKTAPLPASSNYGTSGDVVNSHHNHFLPLHVTGLSPNPILTNQKSMSTATHTHSVNLIPQIQVSQPIIMHTYPSLNSSLQNQVSLPCTVPACSTASNFTIPHGANHGRFQEYQSNSVPRQLLGVRNHAIQRERRHGASSLEPQYFYSHMMSKWVGSLGSLSTQAMNHPTHGAFGFSNHVNPALQYDRYNAATGFSNSRTCYGQNDSWVPTNLLYLQPSFGPTSLRYVNNYPLAYGTPAYYRSNGNQNFYGNNALLSYAAHLNRNQHLNVHQFGSQNENAQYGPIRQDSLPHDESQGDSARKADFPPAFDSSWAENMPPNAKESGAQFTRGTNLSVDDIKHWLLDEEEYVPVEVDGALASEQNIPSSDL